MRCLNGSASTLHEGLSPPGTTLAKGHSRTNGCFTPSESNGFNQGKESVPWILGVDHPSIPVLAVGAPSITLVRRDGRVAEGARLESVFTVTRNVGSNPTLSAIKNGPPKGALFLCRRIEIRRAPSSDACHSLTRSINPFPTRPTLAHASRSKRDVCHVLPRSRGARIGGWPMNDNQQARNAQTQPLTLVHPAKTLLLGPVLTEFTPLWAFQGR